MLVAEYIRHDPEALHPADGVLDEDADAALAAVLLFKCRAEGSSFGLFGRYGYSVAGEFLKESLKAGIHPDPYLLRDMVGEPHPLDDLKVMLLSFGGGAHVPYPPLPGGQDDVLAGMALLLAGVVSRLARFVLRPLDRTLGAVQEHFLGFRKGLKELLDARNLPRGQGEFLPQGRFHDRAQMVVGVPDVPPVAVIEEAQHLESGIDAVVQEDEEELVLHGRGERLPACPGLAPPRGVGEVLLRCRMRKGGGEYREEIHELLRGETGEGAAEPIPFEDFFNGHHMILC